MSLMAISQRGTRREAGARFYRFALRAGALTYSGGMLAEAVLGWPLDPRTTLLSELAARDQPHRRLFQGGDLLSGGLFTVSGILGVLRSGDGRKLRVPPRCTRRGRTVPRLPLYLALFGAATVADACSPLDHRISRGLSETGRRPGEGPSLSHTAHYVTTTIAGLAAVGICLEHHRLQRRTNPTADGRSGRALQRAAGALTIGLLLAGVLTLLSPRLLPGLMQRLQTLAFTALCMDLANEAPISAGEEA